MDIPRASARVTLAVAISVVTVPVAGFTIGAGTVQAAPVQWRVVKGAALGPDGSALMDVTAAGPRDAWAVGYGCGREKAVSCPAIARWNGTQWKSATMPAYRLPTGYDSDLHHFNAVSAASAHDVWVVGNGLGVRVGHWNGRSWSMYRPFGKAGSTSLSDVGIGRGRVWFTGSLSETGDRAVVLSWSSSAGFTREYTHKGSLAALSARPGTGEIWAVGSQKTGPLVVRGTERGGRVRWEESRTPAIPEGKLNQVRAIGADDVWAVGQIGNPYDWSDFKPLALHFDGKSWSQVPLPVSKGRITGLTADASGNIWASGVDPSHPKQVLFMRYMQGAWTTSYGPKLGLPVRHATIGAIPGSSGMWAVGRMMGDSEDSEKDFILRYG
ncbi:hypothetical protein [Microbispora sp. H13382]|uniref:hypothetical protein n=1 Tax=Microbispora sp. H13382 TaxID=2729112 RepID=UPI0015FF8BE2|nr:hypothetical protein [Microbispora sp. H13382]